MGASCTRALNRARCRLPMGLLSASFHVKCPRLPGGFFASSSNHFASSSAAFSSFSAFASSLALARSASFFRLALAF